MYKKTFRGNKIHCSQRLTHSVIQLIRESNVLEIEDVLPFFPDFVLINDFKDEICEALTRFKDQMEDLKAQMSDAAKSSDMIRLDLRRLKKQ